MPTKENSSLPLLISPRLEGENNREYAYRVLRQNIITLQFAPGQTLSLSLIHISEPTRRS